MGPLPARGLQTGKSGTVLSNRRRVIRRATPYGPPTLGDRTDAERGMVMLILCASLARQFEFVQQQWINYGSDTNAGNDTDPLVGLHDAKAKFVIPADPASGHAPFIAEGLPQFVESKGGAYFFMPGVTALTMLGLGIIDPT
jgi:deferrochelatase/peroxidase EfeB